jgi:hypothetical protein
MRRPATRVIVVVSLLLAAAGALPTLAGGPIYAYLRDLPPPIAKLHTCIGPNDRTLRDPNTWRVGKQFVFQIGCPESAPNVTVMPGPDDTGRVRKPDDDPDSFQSNVYYLAEDARGRNARRLVLPVPRADGTTLIVDAFRSEVSPGWSTREETSMATGLAYFDLTGKKKYPPGEFMVGTSIVPIDRPEIKNVSAIWRVTNGKAELIYWAETTEVRKPDMPAHMAPPYKVVIDKRPEK